MHKLLLHLILFCPFPVLPQTIHQVVSPNYTRTGAYSIEQVDIFSSKGNPAALSQIKNAAIAVHGERRYMLSELNNYSVVIGLPTNTGNFGWQAGYFGSRDYNETKLGLVYGRKLGSKVDVGAVFNYQAIKIPGYGNSTAYGFEVGTIFHLTEKLHAGLKLSNPTGGKFNKNPDEKLPSIYSAGFGFDASKKLFAGVEIEKEENRTVNVNAGIQYKFLRELWARAGMETVNSSAWFGLGFGLRSFSVDVTVDYHPVLGFSPGLLLLFNFNRDPN